ncbi:MAG: hypothetical protein GWN58_45435 [Anaerolineae bacterium]|nr:hypothetical protein [Anaerolineae bacterium]
MPRVIINDSSETELFTASNPGQVAVPSGTTISIEQATVTLTHYTGQKAASGSNQIVAAPGAGTRIVVVSFMVQNASAVATTVIMEDGTTDVFTALLQTQGAALSGSFLSGQEWRLSENAALQVNLSAANSHNVNVSYFTESV